MNVFIPTVDLSHKQSMLCNYQQIDDSDCFMYVFISQHIMDLYLWLILGSLPDSALYSGFS